MAFGIGETKAPSTQALLEHAVFLLEVLDHAQLMSQIERQLRAEGDRRVLLIPALED